MTCIRNIIGSQFGITKIPLFFVILKLHLQFSKLTQLLYSQL